MSRISSMGTTLTVEWEGVTEDSAYGAGDVVGDEMEFEGAAPSTGGGGVIKDAIITDYDEQEAETELWVFAESTSIDGDHDEFEPGEETVPVAIISSANGAWFSTGDGSYCRIEVSQRYDCDATSLFVIMVTRGTPTYGDEEGAMVVSLGLLQD